MFDPNNSPESGTTETKVQTSIQHQVRIVDTKGFFDSRDDEDSLSHFANSSDSKSLEKKIELLKYYSNIVEKVPEGIDAILYVFAYGNPLERRDVEKMPIIRPGCLLLHSNRRGSTWGLAAPAFQYQQHHKYQQQQKYN